MAFPVAALLPILAQVGAPLLKQVVAKSVGNAAGGMAKDVANGVIDAIAERLGTASDPGRIAEAYEDDPGRVGAVIREVESERADEWAGALATMMAEVNQTMRGEQKAQGFMQRTWRPFFGLVFSASFGGTIFTLMRSLWTSDVAAINAFASMAGFLIFAFSTGAAVLGVYVWQRSAEKKKGLG